MDTATNGPVQPLAREERTLDMFIRALNRFNGLARNMLRLNQLCGALTTLQMQSVIQMYSQMTGLERPSRAQDMTVWFAEFKATVAAMPRDHPRKPHHTMMRDMLQHYITHFCVFFAELEGVAQDPQSSQEAMAGARMLHVAVKTYWTLLERFYEASAKYSPPLLTDGEICKIFFLDGTHDMQVTVRDSMRRLDDLLHDRTLSARSHRRRIEDIARLFREITEVLLPCRREMVQKISEAVDDFAAVTRMDPGSVPVVEL